MKIGILTFHRSYNYGAFMQCFSLVKRLQRDFPEHIFQVIDYSCKKAIDGYEISLSNIKSEDKRGKISQRNAAFLLSQEQLPLSEWKVVSDDYSETVEYLNRNYDAVIVGSDAVWNWVVRGFPNIYFLKDYKGYKFSFAASAHGMNYQNMSSEQKKYISEAFSDFKYVGVRDITTENMVKYANSTVETFHNCDPTAFLQLNDIPCDMEKLKNKLISRGVDFSKPLIGLMAGESIGREIKSYWKDKAQIISLYEYNKYADVYLYDLSPYEWARVFSFFKVTVTHFFHGTMLSLVNGVPVIPVEFINDFSAINKTKINDVMERLDLLEWRHTADYRDFSLPKKVLKRLGIWRDYKLWNSVNSLVEKFMVEDYRDVIRGKIEEEALSYNSFKSALENIEEK